MKKLLLCAASVGVLLMATGPAASANVLANPGFESPVAAPEYYGAGGWVAFGNAFTTAANPCLVPNSGAQLLKMFGNFSGGFNVTGIFQAFATTPGEQWSLSSHSRFCSDDPMIGNHVSGGTGNWVVQKIAFFDAADAEIGFAAAESVILDGSFAVNTWHNNAPIVGTAPAGAVLVRAFLLYLQNENNFDGGAAQIDDVDFSVVTPIPVESTTWSSLKSLYR